MFSNLVLGNSVVAHVGLADVALANLAFATVFLQGLFCFRKVALGNLYWATCQVRLGEPGNGAGGTSGGGVLGPEHKG